MVYWLTVGDVINKNMFKKLKHANAHEYSNKRSK